MDNYTVKYLSDKDKKSQEIIKYLKNYNIKFTDIKVTKFVDGRKVSYYKPDNLIINCNYILDTDNIEYNFDKPIKLLDIQDIDDDAKLLVFENNNYIEIYQGYVYVNQFINLDNNNNTNNLREITYAPIGWYCWNEDTQDVSCINYINII